MKNMKNRTFTLAAALTAMAVTGCYNPNGTPDNTATGALVGGASGAGLGAIIGSASRNAGAGAAIGAGAGMLLGALIGHSADQAQEARLRQQAPDTYARAAAGTPLSVADVKAMSAAQVADDTIIAQINNSHTAYNLSATDIIDLHNAGVSQKVIDYMINTRNMVMAAPTAAVVAAAPPPVPVEPMLVAPGPGYIWCGGEWVWNGAWVWRAGYWDMAPYPGAIWIGGYWGHGPRGYLRYGGHWGRR
jgi:hypothetical protein